MMLNVLSWVEALIRYFHHTQLMDGLSLEEDDGGSKYQPYQHRHHNHDDGRGSILSSTYRPLYRPLYQPLGRTADPDNSPSSEASSFSLRPSSFHVGNGLFQHWQFASRSSDTRSHRQSKPKVVGGLVSSTLTEKNYLSHPRLCSYQALEEE
eukprot:scaffold4285_cov66-Attheya_sp.AAC.3